VDTLWPGRGQPWRHDATEVVRQTEAALGGIDILINNAAVRPNGPQRG